MPSRAEKAGPILGVLLMGIALPVADTAGLVLPKALRFVLAEGFATGLLFIALVALTQYIPGRILSRFHRTSPHMELGLVIVVGAVIGAVLAPWIWGRLRPDEDIVAAANEPKPASPAATDKDPPKAVESDEKKREQFYCLVSQKGLHRPHGCHVAIDPRP